LEEDGYIPSVTKSGCGGEILHTSGLILLMMIIKQEDS